MQVKVYYILSTVYLPMIPYNIFASFNFLKNNIV